MWVVQFPLLSRRGAGCTKPTPVNGDRDSEQQGQNSIKRDSAAAIESARSRLLAGQPGDQGNFAVCSFGGPLVEAGLNHSVLGVYEFAVDGG